MNKLILEVVYEKTKTKFKNHIVNFSQSNPDSKIKEVLFDLWDQIQPSTIDLLYKKSRTLMENEYLMVMNSRGNDILKFSTIMLGSGMVLLVIGNVLGKKKVERYRMLFTLDINDNGAIGLWPSLPGCAIMGGCIASFFGFVVKYNVTMG